MNLEEKQKAENSFRRGAYSAEPTARSESRNLLRRGS